MADEKAPTVHVLFHENYTVKNDDGATYLAGQVYEMSPASAELFTHWCDCEIVDPLSSQAPPAPVNPANADPALATKVQAAIDRNAKAKATKRKSRKTVEERLDDLEAAKGTTAAVGPATDSTPAPAAAPNGPGAEAPKTAAPVVSAPAPPAPEAPAAVDASKTAAPAPPAPDATAATKGKAAAK
jgi:hypothetical protein